MTVRADMLNGHAICHGGFIFTLADSAFAFACNSYNHNTVASGCAIDFLAPAHEGDTLTAVGARAAARRAHRRLRHRGAQPARRDRSRCSAARATGSRARSPARRPTDRAQRTAARGASDAGPHAIPCGARADRDREPRRARRAAARAPASGRSRTRTTTCRTTGARSTPPACTRGLPHARRPRAVPVHDQGGPARQLSVRHVRRAARPRSRASTRRRARPASRRSSATRQATSTPGRP